MNHEAARELLLDLAYGELTPRLAREVEEHLAACEACRAEWQGIAATRQALRPLREGPEPAPGDRVLLAAAREAADRMGAGRRSRTGLAWPRLAATAVLVLAVGGVSWRLLAERRGTEEERAAVPVDVAGPSRPLAAAPAPEAREAQRPAREPAQGSLSSEATAAAPPAAPPAPSGVAASKAALRPALADAQRDSPPPRPDPEATGVTSAPAAPAERPAPPRAVPERLAVARPPAAPAREGVERAAGEGRRAAQAAPPPSGDAAGAARPVGRSEAAADSPAMARAAGELPAGDLGEMGGREELRLAGTSVRACPGGELRVELWRDAGGRPRRVVRSLAGPPGARTADLSYDESGRLRLARVSGTEAGAPWARVVALDAGGRVLRDEREGPGAPWSEADLPRDAEAALAAPRCP